MGGAGQKGRSRPARPRRRERADDEDALAMLERSHRRLEERLAELQRACSAIVRERGGASELEVIDDVLAYLERSAARHEEDEDESLFPRLRRAPGGRDLAGLLEDLTAEHVLHRHLVGQLHSLRAGWPEAGPDAGEGASLVTVANELVRAYRSHIEREERELLPAARDRLGQAERDAIRAEMGKRRGGRDGGRNGGAGRRRRPAGSTGPRVREV